MLNRYSKSFIMNTLLLDRHRLFAKPIRTKNAYATIAYAKTAYAKTAYAKNAANMFAQKI